MDNARNKAIEESNRYAQNFQGKIVKIAFEHKIIHPIKSAIYIVTIIGRCSYASKFGDNETYRVNVEQVSYALKSGFISFLG